MDGRDKPGHDESLLVAVGITPPARSAGAPPSSAASRLVKRRQVSSSFVKLRQGRRLTTRRIVLRHQCLRPRQGRLARGRGGGGGGVHGRAAPGDGRRKSEERPYQNFAFPAFLCLGSLDASRRPRRISSWFAWWSDARDEFEAKGARSVPPPAADCAPQVRHANWGTGSAPCRRGRPPTSCFSRTRSPSASTKAAAARPTPSPRFGGRRRRPHGSVLFRSRRAVKEHSPPTAARP